MSKPIFDKLLVANRGEIACRVMKTCQRLGIKTVAVYSEVDKQAKHVKMADEAICVGPAPSKDSYLVIDKIIDACVKTGAQAVHPGYGFLSENSDFSGALKRNNIVFVGPDEDAVAAMGDKIHSKKLAHEAGVNTIPGFIGEIESHEQLLQKANEIGYPVMVKASGGGGGKGMHIANNDKECVEYYELCKAEAIAAFNNGKMLVEKFVSSPRHIEIQVIADRCGNTLWLPERECSIQRRNQKVLEEAPSSFIDPDTRRKMGEQAVAMAQKVNYVTAGTVEMMVDDKKGFYFLEMNTRLQVEHPITEMITGVDLVEQMIRASAGLPLSYKQEDIKINGWATESRVYAEDPIKNYFPSIGRLTAYEEPEGPGVRCDSGILDGSQISVYYDPLICKLCTWGEDRAQSISRMEAALDEYVIRGLNHNVCLLRDVIGQKRYQDGNLTTNYLAEEYPKGFVKADISADERVRLNVVGAALRGMKQWVGQQVSCGNKTEVKCNAATYSVSVAEDSEEPRDISLLWKGGENHRHTFAVDGAVKGEVTVEWKVGFPRVKVISNLEGQGEKTEMFQYFGSDEVSTKIQYMGSVFNVHSLTPAERKVWQHMPKVDTKASAKKLLSPMPGVVVDIAVKPGDSIAAGAEILTLEAMKMRNKLRAEVDGVVKAVKIEVGKTVDDGALLVEFE